MGRVLSRQCPKLPDLGYSSTVLTANTHPGAGALTNGEHIEVGTRASWHCDSIRTHAGDLELVLQ